MGAYFGMELNAMAAMLYGQRAEPWHTGADMWGSACQQLLATHGDLGAANATIATWPLSIGSVSQLAFNGQVIGSLASLGEWAAYTGAMSAALRLGGTALNAAQAAMPALQSGYDTAVSLSAVPIIGPFAAQVAVGLQQVGAGMMEAVGVVMQAPTAVPPPTQGWQGPGGTGAPTPASPAPSIPVTDVLDATDKLFSAMSKGATLVQTVAGLAQSGTGLGNGVTTKLPTSNDLLGTLVHPDLPTLAGGTVTPPTTLPATVGVSATTSAGMPGGIPAAVLAGSLGALTNTVRPTTPGGVGPSTGARIAAGTEPGLAGGTARAAASAAKAMPTIAPPMSGAGGGGGSNEPRFGNRKRDALQRTGVQSDLQGRTATESPEQFTLPPVRRRTAAGPVLDNELFR
ncbi:hypothetical protein [Kribbella sindirgiensis]|uniref:PPE domain-containing protein n=1 Tax=Kribbella sindirgiensis TaxID=1124744 RepID=A0A4R0HYU0_9ACTN|nr:hypothetical protein [Kribbella sindirgiensis]TCC18635.1 hypothetical protein E0H50_38600 [Kribbella sindirgiensis]